MGRFSQSIDAENLFATASQTTKSAKDLGITPKPTTKESSAKVPVEIQKEVKKTAPKKPAAPKVRTEKILPKEEKHTEVVKAAEYSDDVKRNPVINLNDPSMKRVRRAYKRGTERKARFTCSIYLTQGENELIRDIAESYEMSVSELVRTVIINLKKADE